MKSGKELFEQFREDHVVDSQDVEDLSQQERKIYFELLQTHGYKLTGITYVFNDVHVNKLS